MPIDDHITSYDQLGHEGRELALYIENTEALYPQVLATERNLLRHYSAGNFDLDLGIKGMLHLVNFGAQQYTREHGSFSGPRWHALFPISERRKVAELFARDLVSRIRSGELDPSQYRSHGR